VPEPLARAGEEVGGLGDLAKRRCVVEERLSELERGDGSFTAEQLLAILSFFNVPATYFAPQPSKHERDLQNALARLGAT
jgi:hypothetical protein